MEKQLVGQNAHLEWRGVAAVFSGEVAFVYSRIDYEPSWLTHGGCALGGKL